MELINLRTLAASDFVGVSDIESLGSYVKTQWRDYSEKLLKEN